jgi:hypothetical protein
MQNFDGRITDPAVPRAEAEALVGDATRVGELLLDRYARAQRLHPRLAAGSRLLSVLDPLPRLMVELNEFSPSLLAG